MICAYVWRTTLGHVCVLPPGHPGFCVCMCGEKKR